MKLKYFDQTIDPAPFGRGFGALSLLIRVVNFWRVYWSRVLCFLILRAQLRASTFSEKEKKEIYARAKKDFDLQGALPFRTKKANTFKESIAPSAPPKNREERAKLRYSQARLGSQETSHGPRPLEAKELSSIFDQVFISQNRSARYLRQRGQETLLVDVESYTDE